MKKRYVKVLVSSPIPLGEGAEGPQQLVALPPQVGCTSKTHFSVT